VFTDEFSKSRKVSDGDEEKEDDKGVKHGAKDGTALGQESDDGDSKVDGMVFLFFGGSEQIILPLLHGQAQACGCARSLASGFWVEDLSTLWGTDQDQSGSWDHRIPKGFKEGLGEDVDGRG